MWHVAPWRAGSHCTPRAIEDLPQVMVALGSILARTSARYEATKVYSSSETSLGQGFLFYSRFITASKHTPEHPHAAVYQLAVLHDNLQLQRGA